jgi:thiol-disulfide isomerase/thioredoxin
MKKLTYLIFVVILLFSACSGVKKSDFYVELTHAKKGTPVYVYVSDAFGMTEKMIPDTFYTDKKGKFSFEVEIEKPKTVLILAETETGTYTSTPLFITEAEKYNIAIAITPKGKESPIPLIEGENNMGMIELIRFRNEKATMDYHKIYDSTQHQAIYSNYDALVSKSMATIDQLFKVKRIDEPFYEFASRSVEYYLAYHTLLYIEQQMGSLDSLRNKTLMEQKNLIIQRAPLNNPDLYQTSVGREYIDMFIPEVIQKNKPEYDESLKKSMGQTFILGKVKELIHKNAYQYYALEYLKSKSLRLDQETITLFNQYIKDFPENTKIQYFQEIQNIVIPDIQAFYADGKGGLNPRITVLDDSLQVTSYRQAVSHFKGNYLFIDIWASWCPDCIKEFAYNTELKSFLKKNDIACLYISLERSPDRAKWKRYLNKYNLIGSHILINDLLKNDLYQVLGTTSLWIPRYILVDPNGNIVLSEGALPSDGTKLYDQIFSKLSYVAQ